jgi:hypothetical protein
MVVVKPGRGYGAGRVKRAEGGGRAAVVLLVRGLTFVQSSPAVPT